MPNKSAVFALILNLPGKLLFAAAIASISAVTSAQENDRVEELTITATRLPRTIETIAGTVSVISAETIERELANDLDDLARFQPGVTLNTANRGGNQGFSIRGIGGNRVLTVIDGVRSNDIYAAGPSSYGKDSFEIDNLRSVEIIRGPASVLYGADAMGGAVILRSKRAEDYVRGETGSYFNVRALAADADTQGKLGATAAFQSDELGVLLQITHREFEEQEVNGPGSLNPQDGDSDNLLLQAFWELSSNQQLTASYESYQEDILLQLESDIDDSVSSSRGHDNTERERFGLQYEWQANLALMDDLQFIANVQTTDGLQNTVQERTSYSFLNPANPMTYGGSQARRVTDFEFNQQTRALNLNLRKTLQVTGTIHAFAYGLNFDQTDTERPRNRCDIEQGRGNISCAIAAYPFAPPEVFPNKTFPDTETTRLGVYLQDEIRIGESGLTLIPGIRYDQYEMEPELNDNLTGVGDIEDFGNFSVVAVDSSEVSLSLGALYNLDDTYSLFAQYAEGYRPPNFDEANQAFVNLGFGYATVPNPLLEAESSQGIELGLRADYENAFVSFALFNNDYEDFIESSFVGMQRNISLFQDSNVGEARIRGAELLANVYLSPQLSLRSSLAYARGDNEVSNTPLDSIEPLTAVVGASYSANNGIWGAQLLLTAVAEKDRVSSTSAVTADGYAVVDVMGHMNLSEAGTVRIGIFNLFDEQYARWSNIQGLDATSLSTIQNAQQPGTNFRVAFDYEF
ncbi:MAG: TonB-dependent hemoglobin/transferrin/lactoferrin family receptor [Proteobacteria bacterium]|nr:TonB-dependent hemoglobin/transferrin/lactoferrin family receptor [Pseudomonadota bacterium]MDA0929137.1 TonB-dependent hemoglobin/transferrin/lactoferrin family receptor [Pseudomonadota bacterium]